MCFFFLFPDTNIYSVDGSSLITDLFNIRHALLFCSGEFSFRVRVFFFFYLGRKQKEGMKRKRKQQTDKWKKSPDLQKQPNRVKRSLKLSGLIFCISNGKASVSRHQDGSLLSRVINHRLRHRNPMGSILYTPLIKEAPLR